MSTDDFFSILTKLSPGQLYELAVTTSRPKKETVSYHSVLSTITVGFTAIALLQTFAPGMRETLGFPRIFNTELYHAGSWHAKATGLLWALVAITGVFRIPPNSPRIRSLLFQQCTAQTIAIYMLQDSNLFLLDPIWSFDLMSWNPGSVFFWGLMVVSLWLAGELLSETIGGPERGRETLPAKGDRFGFSFLPIFSYIGLLQQVPLILLTQNQEAFQNLFLPYAHRLEGSFNSINFLTEAMNGMGMLVATLLFEKKITHTQANWMVFAVVLFSGIIDANIDIADPSVPETRAIAEFNAGVIADYHVIEISLASISFFILKGLWRYYQSTRDTTAPGVAMSTEKRSKE